MQLLIYKKKTHSKVLYNNISFKHSIGNGREYILTRYHHQIISSGWPMNVRHIVIHSFGTVQPMRIESPKNPD